MEKILIIGNSNLLDNTKFGKKIDDFENIVRFNKFNISDKYIEDYGKRFSIWAVNGYDFKNMLDKNKHSVSNIFISSTTKTKKKLQNYLNIKNNKQYTIFDKKYHHNLKEKINYPKNYELSLGIFTILYFLSQNFDVHITNMDHKPIHYFETVDAKLGRNHNWEFEKKYIENLIYDKKIHLYMP